MAWGKRGGKEPCTDTLKAMKAQEQMLAVLPLGFARLALCGKVKWKSLQRTAFLCLLTLVINNLAKSEETVVGGRSLILGCSHIRAGDLSGSSELGDYTVSLSYS